MSLMETYLVVTCPVKGCNMHVDLPLTDSNPTNLADANKSGLSESRSSDTGIENVVKQLDFWHSKTDHD